MNNDRHSPPGCARSDNAKQMPIPEIRQPKPGETGWIVSSHVELYGREWGFDSTFERYLTEGLAQYAAKADSGRSRIWIADISGQPVGSIAIVESENRSAQLRWFLVAPDAQGKGLGRALLNAALEFCRECGFQSVFLWTFKGLAPAKRLYSSVGFVLKEEQPGALGSVHVVEQKWELRLGVS